MINVTKAMDGETSNMPKIPSPNHAKVFFSRFIFQFTKPHKQKAVNACKYGSRMAEPPSRRLSGYKAKIQPEAIATFSPHCKETARHKNGSPNAPINADAITSIKTR